MKVSHQENGPLSSSIEITLEKGDYIEKYEQELKKVRGKAQMKGFRQGKTPRSVIEKMYGKGILAESINEILQEKLWDAIKEKELSVILSPIISQDQEQYDFNIKNMVDYAFTFDVGMKPDFTLQGADKESSINHVKIVADDEIVNKEFEMVRKRLGTEVSGEKDINDEDRVTIHANEIDEKGNVVKKGWETGFQVLVNTLKEEYKEQLLGKDKDFEFDFDIYVLEKDRKEDYVKKYLLNLDENEEKEIGRMFRGKINEIHRIEPAEVNQEFFDKYLGEGIVTTEEEAKEKIRENISEYYAGQATAFLHRNIMDKLIDENPMEMPKEFIRKWLIRNNEEVTAEQIDSEIDAFITNMKWDLISDQVKEKYEAEVKTEDVRAKIKVQISQYFGGQMPNMDIEPLVDNLMKDEKQFKQAYQEAASEKVLQSVADNITLVEEEVSLEKFGEMVKEMNERLEKR